MWKDFFNFSKNERRAIWVLLGLIGIGISLQIYLSGQPDIKPEDRVGELAFEQDIKAFEATRFRERWKYNSYQHKDYRTQTYALFDFDPNTADSITLVHLGLKPFMARMILKYRTKGGRYRKPDDFAKVPYLDKSLYARLLPHIKIDQRMIAVHRDTVIRYKPIVYQKQEKLAEGMHIDLNSSDTTDLKKIPGVGSGIAQIIVNYRNHLGGFYSINQLREIKQFSPEQVDKFSHFLALSNSQSTRKIPVNKSGIERLMSHPYLNFYQAKAIVELKKKKGKLTSMNQLSLYEEFTKQDFERLAHYLDFSQ